jgi:hypothetical protein
MDVGRFGVVQDAHLEDTPVPYCVSGPPGVSVRRKRGLLAADERRLSGEAESLSCCQTLLGTWRPMEPVVQTFWTATATGNGSLCHGNAAPVFFARVSDKLKGTQQGDCRPAEETYAVSWARTSTVQSDGFWLYLQDENQRQTRNAYKARAFASAIKVIGQLDHRSTAEAKSVSFGLCRRRSRFRTPFPAGRERALGQYFPTAER